MLALLEASRGAQLALATTAPVVAQAWRSPKRQARLSAFLKQPEVEILAFAPADARAAGELAAMSRHHDVVDVHVVLSAQRRGYTIVTSDPGDVRKIDPRVKIVPI